jgi:hypothetical protein
MFYPISKTHVIYRAFYLYDLEKNGSSLCGFFFELSSMALKRFIPSMVFHQFLPLDGVKSRVKRPFCPWHKKIAEFCLFVVYLE